MRLILCDEELMFSEMLAELFRARGDTVLSCTTHPAMALQMARPAGADVLVTDIHFPTAEGRHSVWLWRTAVPATPLVVLTSTQEPQVLHEAALAGADGIALKDEPFDEIERVVRGVTSPAFLEARDSEQPKSLWSDKAQAVLSRRQKSPFESFLTAREREVLECVLSGDRTAELAATLGISEATVHSHLQSLFTKFGVHSRLGLVARAASAGMVRGELSSHRR